MLEAQKSIDESVRKSEIIKKIIASGIVKDPQWLERLDEPAPLWVVLDALLQMMEEQNPPHRPYD
ncbi:hypothetical protein AB6A23_14750 [Paenibacillus tarimensis]